MKSQRTTRYRRGLALVYVAVGVVAICAVGSLALDYARAQCVRTQLRCAAEAGAMAALYELRNGNGVTAAQNAAVSVAASNVADGIAVVVDANADVEFGSYDASTDTFTTLGGAQRSAATAIHVTCRRTTARGNAVSLTLGPVIGRNTVDVNGDAVAAVNSPSAFNIVGIDSCTISNVDIDSFDSSAGAYGGSNVKGNAAIATNGNLVLSSSCHIHSEAHPGSSGSLTKDGGSQINYNAPFNSGSNYPVLSAGTGNLTSALYYPLPDVGTAATVNNNSQLSSVIDASNNVTITGDTTVTGGTFYINNLTINHDKKFTFNSDTVIYVNGTINNDGQFNAYLTNPCNLSIYVMGSGAVGFTADKPFYGMLYAPLSAVTLSNGERWGSVVGKTLSMTSKKFHADEALYNGSDGGPAKKKWLKKPQHWH